VLCIFGGMGWFGFGLLWVDCGLCCGVVVIFGVVLVLFGVFVGWCFLLWV